MNIKEIDKWLDNEYGVSYTRLEELFDFILERDMKYQDKIDNLQQRIDKTIEWIKEDYDGGYFECGENDIKELLKILGDKEDETN